MNRIMALLRPLLLTSASALSACVASPGYAPPAGRVYVIDDPWFYRGGHRYCHELWYGCAFPYYRDPYYGAYYGGYYGGFPPPPVHQHPPHPKPPSEPPPADPPPVYAPKPPRLIRLRDDEPAPGQVLRPAPDARAPAAPVPVAPKPVHRPAPRPTPRAEQEPPAAAAIEHARKLREQLAR
ncbi:hypothetical protein [Sinimarinibacterium thermocellulolyticum]|uniref:Lipoprotein n=1 Tax=Sinimarinibacterium thermocellulolyticum TaxID=3170016 RepID=A0ABV2A6Z1_9GAMM